MRIWKEFKELVRNRKEKDAQDLREKSEILENLENANPEFQKFRKTAEKMASVQSVIEGRIRRSALYIARKAMGVWDAPCLDSDQALYAKTAFAYYLKKNRSPLLISTWVKMFRESYNLWKQGYDIPAEVGNYIKNMWKSLGSNLEQSDTDFARAMLKNIEPEKSMEDLIKIALQPKPAQNVSLDNIESLPKEEADKLVQAEFDKLENGIDAIISNIESVLGVNSGVPETNSESPSSDVMKENERLREENSNLRLEIANLKLQLLQAENEKLKAENEKLKSEFKSEIENLRSEISELKTNNQEKKSEIKFKNDLRTSELNEGNIFLKNKLLGLNNLHRKNRKNIFLKSQISEITSDFNSSNFKNRILRTVNLKNNSDFDENTEKEAETFARERSPP